MFFRLFTAFALIPLIELYLLIEVGARIGGAATVLLVLATAAAGAALARAQGTRVLMSVRAAMQEGRVPDNELIQGLLILVGGGMLLTPGFLTDALGFALILPGSRQLIASRLRRFFADKIQQQTIEVEFRTPP